MTMSISSAPNSTAARTSASFTSSGAWPDGNSVATEATFTVDPAQASSRGRDEVRVHAHGGHGRDRRIGGIGVAAPSSRAPRPCPGVSAPSSVVRSIIRTDSSSAKSFASFLIERFASSPARASRATASIAPIRGMRGSSGSSKPCGSAGAWVMPECSSGRSRAAADVLQLRCGAAISSAIGSMDGRPAPHRARFRRLCDQTGDVLLVVGREGRIASVNEAGARGLGYTTPTSSAAQLGELFRPTGSRMRSGSASRGHPRRSLRRSSRCW